MAEFAYYKGDMFESPDTVFGHGCNAHGAMGAGLARYIRMMYPNVYDTYRDAYESEGLVPGSIIPAYMNEYDGDPRIMLNIITQIPPGPHASEDLIFEGLDKSLAYCNRYGFDSLTIPAIGCGIGGLDSLVLYDILISLDSPVRIKLFLQ